MRLSGEHVPMGEAGKPDWNLGTGRAPWLAARLPPSIQPAEASARNCRLPRLAPNPLKDHRSERRTVAPVRHPPAAAKRPTCRRRNRPSANLRRLTPIAQKLGTAGGATERKTSPRHAMICRSPFRVWRASERQSGHFPFCSMSAFATWRGKPPNTPSPFRASSWPTSGRPPQPESQPVHSMLVAPPSLCHKIRGRQRKHKTHPSAAIPPSGSLTADTTNTPLWLYTTMRYA